MVEGSHIVFLPAVLLSSATITLGAYKHTELHIRLYGYHADVAYRF